MNYYSKYGLGTGDGLVGGVDTGGRFAVSIRIAVVTSMGIGVSRVTVSVVRISGISAIVTRVQDSGVSFSLTLPAGTGDRLVGGIDAGGGFEGRGAKGVVSGNTIVTSQTVAIVASEAITVT